MTHIRPLVAAVLAVAVTSQAHALADPQSKAVKRAIGNAAQEGLEHVIEETAKDRAKDAAIAVGVGVATGVAADAAADAAASERERRTDMGPPDPENARRIGAAAAAGVDAAMRAHNVAEAIDTAMDAAEVARTIEKAYRVQRKLRKVIR